MRAALSDLNFSVFDPENYPILAVDTNAPKTGKIAGKRFGFAHTFITVSVNVFKEIVYFFQSLFILSLPV